MSSIGRGLPSRPEVAGESVWLGTDYGGAWASLRGLDGRGVVYSVGVGEDVSFDLELIRRTGVTVHAFDPTPRSIAWVRSQQLPPNFVMHGIGLAAYDGVARFRPPEDPSHVSHTLLGRSRTEHAAIEVVVKRLATLMGELGQDRVDLLKMDIEGAEYDVIDDILASGVRVDQLLVEFHHQLREVPVSRTRRAVAALRAAGYRILHVSEDCRHYCFLHERALAHGA